jgi:hypothetical protein
MLLFGITTISAQNYKFGKITIDALTSVDTASVATILYKKQNTFYEYKVDNGFVLITEYEKRIKINDVEGVKYANIELELYDESDTKKETIESIKGVTYNLVNGKVEKTKLKNKEVFEEKFNKYWKKIKIAMPNVKQGSVFDIKYYTESPFVHNIKDVILQESIPVKEFDYQASIPEYFEFNLHENIKSNHKINIGIDGRNVRKDIKWKEKVNQNGGFVLQEFERTLEYKDKIIKFNEKNIPEFSEESFSVSLNSYVIKLAFDLKSTKSFDDKIRNYASSWDLITRKIYESDSFGGELNKTNYFKGDIDSLNLSDLSQIDKINSVFWFVKSKVKWNDFTGYIPDLGLRKAYKEGKGNVADINLMLVAALRYVGVSANPILVSTKSNGEAMFPTRQGFNYVICGVEVDNDVLLLDATELNSSINILPERVLNWKGRIVREHGSSAWVNLFPKKNSVNTKMVFAKLNKELQLIGKTRNQKSDYFAFNYRSKFGGVKTDDVIKELSKDKGGISITNLDVKNVNQFQKPVQQTYDFVYENGVEEIGEDLYLSPKLFLTEEYNIFNKETRNHPVDFKYPRTNKNIINITIPKGYKVKSIPESVKLVMSDNLGEYSFFVKQNGITLQVSESLDINFPIVPVSYYSELKLVYEKMIEKNAEKIVLEKI